MKHIRFPPSEPTEQGWLDRPDGHRLYWEWTGSPTGRPALFLHGGPGAGASPGARRFFDPHHQRAWIVDQRGCGRSRPLAAEMTDLTTLNTPALIDDLEALRIHHGVPAWDVVGVSWGSTLGLAYAQAHPERITGLVLGLVGTTSAAEVAWITEGVGCLFPEAWDRLSGGIPPALRHLPLVDAYARLLLDPDPEVHHAAAQAWCDWEDTHVSLSPGHLASLGHADPAFRLGFARQVTHFWRHAAFLPDGQLLRDMPRLDGIPGRLIHGRFDVSTPVRTAWLLAQRWSTGSLEVLEDTGHGDADAFPEAMIRAMADLRDRSPRGQDR